MFIPTNHRNNKLYCSCSISIRSLRTVYNTCISSARSSFSGAIDGRPNVAYIWLNTGDNAFKATSAIARIGRNGCSAGTRSSGET